MIRKKSLRLSLVILLAVSACRQREETPTAVNVVEKDAKPLFKCSPEGGEAENVLSSLRIFMPLEEQQIPPENVFIAIGDGVRVRGKCGERSDLGLKSVFACWYSGGGLTIYWPGKTPDPEAVVQVDRKRLFGAIDNAMHRLKCFRQAELDFFTATETM